jgi:type I restriction enzyme R subunit
VHYQKALVDIISMVKHAAREDEELLTAEERIDRAFATILDGKTFTAEQTAWLDRIRAHLIQNLSINEEDFEIIPVFADQAAGDGQTRFWKPALKTTSGIE